MINVLSNIPLCALERTWGNNQGGAHLLTNVFLFFPDTETQTNVYVQQDQDIYIVLWDTRESKTELPACVQ